MAFYAIGLLLYCFFFQAEDGIRDHCVTGVQTCALPISIQGSKTKLRQCLERLSVAWLIPAFGLCLGYWFFNAGVWSWILESLGYPLPYLVGVRAWLTSESLRWLPGGVWKLPSRVVPAPNLSIPLAHASLSLPVELAAAVVSWVIVAIGGILLSGFAGRFG